MKHNIYLAPMLLLAIGLLAGSGCGKPEPKKNPLSGTVKWKGKDVKLGSISFRSEGDGKYVATGEIKDGKYAIPQISGLPSGKYHVAISYPDPKIPAPRPDEPPSDSGLSDPSKQPREQLPKKFNDESELKVDIVDGSNDQVNFDLK